jgi:hypothetical protein
MELTAEEKARVEKARDIIMRSAGHRNFPPLLWDMMKPGFAVHADRGVGKTEALLTAVFEREEGKAIIVIPNAGLVEQVKQRYHDTFKPDNPDRGFPFFVSPGAISATLEGWNVPIYIDDWWLLSPSQQKRFAECGRVVGAVGSMPGLGGCIEAFPLTDRRANGLAGISETHNDGTMPNWGRK